MEDHQSRPAPEGNRLVRTGAVFAFVLAVAAWILLGCASIVFWLPSFAIGVFVLKTIRRDRLPRKVYVTAWLAVVMSGAGILFFTGMIGLSIWPTTHAPSDATLCANNLHQLGLAMSCYQSDYSDKFPDPGNWPQLIHNYVRTTSIFRCPMTSTLQLRKYPVKVGMMTEALVITYAMNERLRGLSVRDVKKPDETVLLFESNGEKLSGGPELLPKGTRHEERTYIVVRHPYINVLFADWHVNKVPLEEVPHLKWDPK